SGASRVRPNPRRPTCCCRNWSRLIAWRCRKPGRGDPSQYAEQIVGIEQTPGDFRLFFHRAADRRRYALPRLAAQPRMSVELHVDATYAAHLAMRRFDVQANAQLFVHALLHALEII